jgi:hypothetical protein
MIIMLIILLIIVILIITKVKVLINIHHSQDDDHIKLKFSAWFGLIKYTINVPLIKIDNNSPSIIVEEEGKSNIPIGDKKTKKKKKFTAKEMLKSLEDAKTVLEHVIGLHKIIRNFFRTITITKLQWHTIFGIGDAALTGMLVGVGWSVKGGLVGLISHYMKLETKPDISITPAFQSLYSDTKLECMIHFRLGHAMLAGIRLVTFWKGGKPNFKTAPLSKLPGVNSEKSIKS